MAIRIIVKDPDPVLHKRCREVEVIDDKVITLLDDMIETLHAANGAGLAAPQVGILKRICIVETEDGFFELINPVLKSGKGTQTGVEGCLSVPGKYGKVSRFNEVKVEAFARDGKKYLYKVKGFTARAFQHEMDHLDGIVYTSKATDMQDD
ncbi:MAG: peptide deformylase [Clostridia bacterium]|nr:peptide deformylase [Clostridia bacterium]